MGGTLLNALTVLVGSLAGMLVGNRLPERVQQSVLFGLGLVTLAVGIDNARATSNILVPLMSIALGVLLGEWLGIEAALTRLAGWIQARTGAPTPPPTNDHAPPEATATPALATDARARFVAGFVTASLLFCVGPLTFLGSMLDGMGLPQGFQMLAVKSVLDLFASLALASAFGVGVLFSVVTVLGLQGGLALLGALFGQAMSDAMIAEMTATGGLVLMGLALVLMDIKRPRMANFLPALVIAPLIVALATWLGINITPQF